MSRKIMKNYKKNLNSLTLAMLCIIIVERGDGEMNKTILSSSYLGVKSFLVEVEIDISNGLPFFSIIGLGDTAISESRDRIRTALKNSDFPLPPKKIIVNLSPAGIRKEGVHFDLPIAVGVMATMGFVKDRHGILKDYLFVGELSLSGNVKPIKGALNMVIFAKEHNFKGIVVPRENFEEASLIENLDIVPVSNLNEVVDFVTHRKVRKPEKKDVIYNLDEEEELDFADVKGQSFAKRALEIAAAGKHNIIMIGSPGCGKTMLCKRFKSILPPLNEKEIIEVTKIHSVAGELSSSRPIITTPPFRTPHHTSTKMSIIGGGQKIAPGEVALASHGVLFLDEIGEFSKSILECLRQPLEDKIISISRTHCKVDFTTDFILIATANPCPCGFYYEGDRCVCSQYEINRYQKKFSGPIMDRIDIHIQMKKLNENELVSLPKGESSSEIKKRVMKAREIQKKRFAGELYNADMNQHQLEKYCKLSRETKELLKNAVKSMEISARGYDKILKIARTIADLEGSTNIEKKHMLEALSFR